MPTKINPTILGIRILRHTIGTNKIVAKTIAKIASGLVIIYIFLLCFLYCREYLLLFLQPLFFRLRGHLPDQGQ